MTTDQYLATVKRANKKRARASDRRVSAESDFTEAIVSASAAGIPYRAIAEVADISHQRVAQIVQASRYPSAVVKP